MTEKLYFPEQYVITVLSLLLFLLFRVTASDTSEQTVMSASSREFRIIYGVRKLILKKLDATFLFL